VHASSALPCVSISAHPLCCWPEAASLPLPPWHWFLAPTRPPLCVLGVVISPLCLSVPLRHAAAHIASASEASRARAELAAAQASSQHLGARLALGGGHEDVPGADGMPQGALFDGPRDSATSPGSSARQPTAKRTPRKSPGAAFPPPGQRALGVVTGGVPGAQQWAQGGGSVGSPPSEGSGSGGGPARRKRSNRGMSRMGTGPWRGTVGEPETV